MRLGRGEGAVRWSLPGASSESGGESEGGQLEVAVGRSVVVD